MSDLDHTYCSRCNTTTHRPDFHTDDKCADILRKKLDAAERNAPGRREEESVTPEAQQKADIFRAELLLKDIEFSSQLKRKILIEKLACEFVIVRAGAARQEINQELVKALEKIAIESEGTCVRKINCIECEAKNALRKARTKTAGESNV